MDEERESVVRMTRDLVNAAITLSHAEARYLVDAYYMMQKDRIRAGHQLRSLGESGEPNLVLGWLSGQSELLENQIKRALDKYTAAHPVGSWMRAIKGIGPVIAAGLLAHIDINKAPTAGHIWNFAGLNPGIVWAKGQKRPFNARLKTLCYKVGESFVKVSGDEESFYGSLWAEKKKSYRKQNDDGANAERALQILLDKKIGKTTDAYQWYSGQWVTQAKYVAVYNEGKTEDQKVGVSEVLRPMLPPAHVHAMARRWIVKLFLSHLHWKMYRHAFGKDPALPYAIAIQGHAHLIEAPGI